jgi:type IV pilus assembly protein PilA
MKKQLKQGFTLIEILIVAIIIALLAAVGAVTYTSVNRSSRDARRKADLEQMRTAFEQWRSDNSSYPTLLTVDCNSTGGLTNVVGAITNIYL